MVTDILNRLREYRHTHPRATTIGSITLIVALISYLYVSFYVVYIPVTASKEGMDLTALEVQAYSSNSANTALRESKKLLPNFVQIVPRSFNYFEARTDDYVTIQSAHTHHWLPFRTIPLELVPQKDMEKISTSGGACPVISKSDTVYTYRCGNPRFLFSHNTSTSPWSIGAKNLLSPYRIVVPFKEGLIGVRPPSAVSINRPFTYIDPDTGENTNLKAPAKLTDDTSAIANITTDSADKNSSYAVLTDSKRQKIYVINFDTAEIVREVEYPEDTYTAKSNVSCSMTHANISCYIGRYTASPENTTHEDHDHESEDEHHHDPEEPERSVALVFDTSRDSKVEEITVTSYIKEIVVGKDSHVYAIDTWDNLVELTEGTQRLIARSASQINYVDNLVFISNNQLYSYDERSEQSHLVFKSDATSLSTATSYGSQLLSLFATDGTSTSPNLYIFQVSSKDYIPSTQSARAIDMLSLYKDVESIDYNGQEVEIVLKLLAGKTPTIYQRPDGSGAVTYDEQSVAAAESAITNKLKDLGIDTEALSIDYSF